jgi:transcriptional regulator with XRE-family HTH domain
MANLRQWTTRDALLWVTRQWSNDNAAAVAKALGVSEIVIEQWATGKRIPTAFDYRRLAEFAGARLVSENELRAGDGDTAPPSRPVRALQERSEAEPASRRKAPVEVEIVQKEEPKQEPVPFFSRWKYWDWKAIGQVARELVPVAMDIAREVAKDRAAARPRKASKSPKPRAVAKGKAAAAAKPAKKAKPKVK